MAKPIHQSSPPLRAPPDAPTPRSSSSSAVPSAALLSVLAGIVAASPVAAASPAPPSFLCPSAIPQPSSSSLRPPSVPSPHRSRSRRSVASPTRTHLLPYKFEPGDDGIWRHVDSYSLYGSTICPNPCKQPTSVATADEVSASTNTTDGIDLHDSMPVGWSTEITHDDTRTTLILVLSLVLAFFICFFMIGCLLWRKTVKRRHKLDDVEMKAIRKRRPASVVSSSAQSLTEEQKKARSKQKIWARASARWKEHVRYTARLRRAKRSPSSRLRQYDSSTTLNPTVPVEAPADVRSTQSLTPTPSRSVSRRPSTFLTDPSRSSLHLPQETSDNSGPSPSLTVDLVPNVPSSPPAYRRGTLLNPVTIPAEQSDGPASSVPSCRPSFDVSSSKIKSVHSAQEPESSYVMGPHAAHVATDDKALLARLVDLAERPPEMLIEADPLHQASVPVWEDEQLDDFTRVLESSEPDTSGSSSQPPFPPPPSKGKMAESSFYAYRSSFEEFSELIDPELEPSAPPFEAPSAPGLDGMAMLPSAPPLAEDVFPVEECPSAPEFDAAAEGGGAPESAAVDGDRSIERQSTTTARPLSEGTLPGYHP